MVSQTTGGFGAPGIQSSAIVAQSLVELLQETVPDLQAHLAELDLAGALRRFPDGSLYIEGMRAIEQFYKVYYYPGVGALMHKHSFRCLVPFGERYFELHFPRSYRESLGELSFFVGEVVGFAPVASEIDLA